MSQINFDLIKAGLDTPAFVIDSGYIKQILDKLKVLRKDSACKVLFAIKSLPLEQVIKLILDGVDGLSVSALFEARLADQLNTKNSRLHLSTPGLRTDEMQELGRLCRYISFNSLGGFQRLVGALPKTCSPGLRINPGLSFSADSRYDPCRQYSKLGVPLQELVHHWSDGIQGLHFHTVFNQHNFTPLIKTVKLIEVKLGQTLANLDWMNLGGGYLFDDDVELESLSNLVLRLRKQYDIEVFIEPGKALVGKAGYLVATVIDLFNNQGKTIAILDTSVNHNPEVFEYQKSPTLQEHDETGNFPVLLAGSTCLAGDIFGEYRFSQPLQLSDRLVFTDVGAYTLIKANRFNGYNLPNIYSFDNKRLKLIKRHSYQHYQQQWLSD